MLWYYWYLPPAIFLVILKNVLLVINCVFLVLVVLNWLLVFETPVQLNCSPKEKTPFTLSLVPPTKIDENYITQIQFRQSLLVPRHTSIYFYLEGHSFDINDSTHVNNSITLDPPFHLWKGINLNNFWISIGRQLNVMKILYSHSSWKHIARPSDLDLSRCLFLLMPTEDNLKFYLNQLLKPSVFLSEGWRCLNGIRIPKSPLITWSFNSVSNFPIYKMGIVLQLIC